MTTEQKVATVATVSTLGGRTPLTRVQLQFDGHPDRAGDVGEWFTDRYPHLASRCSAQPGLTIVLRLPNGPYDGAWGWPARLIQATGPLDLAMDMLIECFDELEMGPVGVVSLHVTELLEHVQLD